MEPAAGPYLHSPGSLLLVLTDRAPNGVGRAITQLGKRGKKQCLKRGVGIEEEISPVEKFPLDLSFFLRVIDF